VKKEKEQLSVKLKKITMKIIQAYKDANKEWEYFQEKKRS
jgi:hypothetical protein